MLALVQSKATNPSSRSQGHRYRLSAARELDFDSREALFEGVEFREYFSTGRITAFCERLVMAPIVGVSDVLPHVALWVQRPAVAQPISRPG